MRNPTLATYAKPFEVRLRATAKAASEREAEAMLSPVLEEVCAMLGPVVYGVDVSGLPQTCFRLLEERGLTLATAESCTGGRAAEKLTALPGASRVYRGGVVSYWTDIKREFWAFPASFCLSTVRYRSLCPGHGPGRAADTGADLGVSCHRRGGTGPRMSGACP